MRYTPGKIEPKWQEIWEQKKAFRTETDLKKLKNKKKFYVLDMFPYPSGAGLHVGHPEGYTATDVVSRFKRMKDFEVLHPMGWDAFGLPAERAAVRDNEHPAVITKRNIDNFRRQIKRLGFSYDWDREFSTTDEDYYKWTQWIFLKLYEKGLAYQAEVPVNWCPALGTVLANEEVKDGQYVETGDPVERRMMKQWMLKITAYAERLLVDLETVDWPEGVKEMQRNWIGKSTGAEIDFLIQGNDGSVDSKNKKFTVFTTRPDTLFGATYCVLAPEHPLVEKITTDSQQTTVKKYIKEATQKTDLLRTELAKEKTGVFTGAYALHPVTEKPLPIWVADYVLMTYGTGAIMAVPAHDQRDHDFAKTFGLPIIQVLEGATRPIDEIAHEGEGSHINSDFLNGLDLEPAKSKMIQWLVKSKKGTEKIQYRLRDWLFSRQRYWGEPFPVVHTKDGQTVLLSEQDLPVSLPAIDEYKPTDDGRPPLARAPESWLHIKLPDGREATRETNTMPQWAGSCWYYLRYIDPKNTNKAWAEELEKFWMPVDLYVGGVEHAVLHLLDARFWHKVLFDCGLVSTAEPFQKLFNQGMILAYSYQDKKGKYYHPSDIEDKDGKAVLKTTGEVLKSQIEKMSKSKLNVVNPDDVIDQYGADAMRLYELFMGPLDQVKPWQMDGVDGVYRFLCRLWRLIFDEHTGELNEKIVNEPAENFLDLNKILHQSIKKVEEDTENLRFNTAISQLMIFLNAATSAPKISIEIVLDFLKIVAPYAPHIAEELWDVLSKKANQSCDLIAWEKWPVYNKDLCVDDEVTVVVMVNGKKRDDLKVAKGLSKEQLQEKALASEKLKNYLANFAPGKPPKKIIIVPDKLVNIVI